MDISGMDARMKEARSHGALYHTTNPPDTWCCPDCGVFGRGDLVCWSCDQVPRLWQCVPQWGGGAQTVAPSDLEVPETTSM